MTKKIPLLLFILLTLINSAYTNESAKIIKAELENELIADYLPRLIKKFGPCSLNEQECIIQEKDYLTASFVGKKTCFPYTVCGFYHCMEETYHCEEVGNNYFTKLAYPTCEMYVKNIEKNYFTSAGVKWIYSVMVCLQKGLIDDCELLGNCPIADEKTVQKLTCDHITEFTLAYHPGCYINSSIGVCNLPLQDKIRIWQTVSPFMTAREKDEAYKVIFKCLKRPSV